MKRSKCRADETDFLKAAVAGIAGGLLASLVMEQFQALWSKAAAALRGKPEGSEGKPAMVKATDAITRKMTGHDVPKSKQSLAGETVHYSIGVTSGAIYGLAAEVIPLATIGQGAGFGAAVFLLADEVSVPALGLSASPAKMPVMSHVYALASHLVYGWTTEVVRDAVRRALK